MKIDFEEGDAGFFEARALHTVIRAAREAETPPDARPLLDFLQECATAHVARPEYSELRYKHGIDGTTWPSFSIVKHVWRHLVGPSKREATLSQQRSDALQRAERAEHSAFEALAETARISRERDQARADVARLQRDIAKLNTGASEPREPPVGN